MKNWEKIEGSRSGSATPNCKTNEPNSSPTQLPFKLRGAFTATIPALISCSREHTPAPHNILTSSVVKGVSALGRVDLDPRKKKPDPDPIDKKNLPRMRSFGGKYLDSFFKKKGSDILSKIDQTPWLLASPVSVEYVFLFCANFAL